MNQLIDLMPVVLFAIVFFLADIYYATGALIIGITIQITAMLLTGKSINTQLKVTFWVSLIIGGMTLLLRDETFIQWKPTVVNWLLAATLLGSEFVGTQNVLKRILSTQLELEDDIWKVLNLGWSLGFFAAGTLNLVVAYNFSMEFWVGYKLVGGFGITLLYVLLTILYLNKKGALSAPASTLDSE